MDKFAFDSIVKCIRLGAPIYADELTNALMELVNSEAKLKKELRLRNEPKKENS